MFAYYDPSVEPVEYVVDDEFECEECSYIQRVDGVGSLHEDGDVWFRWLCERCHHENGVSSALFTVGE